MVFMETANNSMGDAWITIKKFDGKKNFNLWKVQRKDIFVQQGVIEAIDGKDNKPMGMTDADWDWRNLKALNTI